MVLLCPAVQAQLRSGDMLFVQSKESSMEKAISASTGVYTHVAMIERDSVGNMWVIEATTSAGVQRVPYDVWRQSCNDSVEIYRLAVPFDTAGVVHRAKSFVGQPYDDSFLPDNGKMYCSELIYEAFVDSAGRHLFQNRPMSFRDRHGRMPRYWRKHFRKLGIPIPEGVPGTNPTDISHSPILKKISTDGKYHQT